MTPTFAGEIQLAGWSDTHTGGCKVTFWLQSQEDLDVFKALTTRKGNTAGHRFMAALVEIGDDEQPVQPIKDEAPKGGPLAKEAAILCAREDFQTWVCAETEQAAAQSVREMAGVMSRKEFDVDPAAGDRFIQCVRVPWLRHVKQIAAVRPQHQ